MEPINTIKSTQKSFNKKSLSKKVEITGFLNTQEKKENFGIHNSLSKNQNNNENNSSKQNENSRKLSIYLGSYEGNLFSVELDLKSKELESYKFKVSENSLKVITHQSQFIFASGIDEMIHIYDMKKKEEKGLFVTYAGSISNIFIVKDFLLACGDDCNIPIWRMSDFSLLHTLKGHKKSVIGLSVHKSGKFCISSSKDNTLIVWNLMNGLKIIKYNLKNLICNKIIFLNDEEHAAIIFDFEIWIFNYMKNSESHEEWIEKKVKSPFRIFDVISVSEKIILFSNLGEIAIYSNIIKTEDCKDENPNKINDEFIRKQIDKPEKLDKEDLDIRIKALNFTRGKKLGLLNVIFSNNEIYVYDLNKIMNLENTIKIKDNINEDNDENINENTYEKNNNSSISVVKKFKSINLKTVDRLTCLDSQILNI